MNGYAIPLSGASLTALASGALWWGARKLLVVSDLHLGKSDRAARRSGAVLPPYETEDTLARLDALIQATDPHAVICLGDTFDDRMAAETLDEAHRLWLLRLMAGRRWIWVEGNHDPGPLTLGGTHLAEHVEAPLVFRHIALPEAEGEVSGHYHPKARVGSGVSRPCFLIDRKRLILPAFGTYTGGLRSDSAVLCDLMGEDALALLTGQREQIGNPDVREALERALNDPSMDVRRAASGVLERAGR
jgi:DNA ligase-associated metallophosphoesterase